MKILFINTVDNSGGAAIAMYRLQRKLEQKFNTNNLILVGDKNSTDNNVVQTSGNFTNGIFELITTKLLNKIGLQSIFAPFSTKNLISQVKKFNPDIIHVHNMHGGYFKINNLKILSKIAPLVITLHDQWALTGHCSYSNECDKWKIGCENCPDKDVYPEIGLDTTKFLWKNKYNLYNSIDNIHFVASSNWIYSMLLESNIDKKDQLNLIRHGIDETLFDLKDKACAKKLLEIPINAKSIIFTADDLSSHRKGADLVLDVLENIDKRIKEDLYIILVGNGSFFDISHLKNIKLVHIGYVSSPRFMSLCFQAADVFTFASRQELFGLVLAEANLCQVPAIIFKVGGSVEIVKNNISGYVIEPFNIEEYSNKLLYLLNNESERLKLGKIAREHIIDKFSLDSMAENYYKLYNQILKK